MIKLFHAENFGCLKNVEFELTPLHAFIGPNDSGKSTLLNAIDTLGALGGAAKFRRGGLRVRLLPEEPKRMILQALEAGGAVCSVEGNTHGLTTGDGPRSRFERILEPTPITSTPEYERFAVELARARIARFDPDALRQPSPLIPLEKPELFFEQRGKGLSGIIGSIYLRGEEEPIARIREKVKLLFPGIQRVGPVSINDQAVELEAVLVDGTKVRAPELSEGLLYYLAFFVLQYLESVSILLIEEPENGLHPSRIADVIRVLRNLTEAKGLQVIMSTHSPLVINQLKPEEVSIVTRANAEKGTVVTPMTKTPNFEARSKVLNLGELWLSYANGKDEADLLNDPPGLSAKGGGKFG